MACKTALLPHQTAYFQQKIYYQLLLLNHTTLVAANLISISSRHKKLIITYQIIF